MEGLLLAKVLHILGAVVFLGNIIVTAFWKVLADKTNNPAIIAFSQRAVTLSDFAFTATGAAILYITGRFFLAESLGEIDTIPWLAWGHGLFVVSDVLWGAVLIPIQVKQARLANAFRNQQSIPHGYRQLSIAWGVVGSITTVLPLIVVYLMVVKPQ